MATPPSGGAGAPAGAPDQKVDEARLAAAVEDADAPEDERKERALAALLAQTGGTSENPLNLPPVQRTGPDTALFSGMSRKRLEYLASLSDHKVGVIAGEGVARKNREIEWEAVEQQNRIMALNTDFQAKVRAHPHLSDQEARDALRMELMRASQKRKEQLDADSGRSDAERRKAFFEHSDTRMLLFIRDHAFWADKAQSRAFGPDDVQMLRSMMRMRDLERKHGLTAQQMHDLAVDWGSEHDKTVLRASRDERHAAARALASDLGRLSSGMAAAHGRIEREVEAKAAAQAAAAAGDDAAAERFQAAAKAEAAAAAASAASATASKDANAVAERAARAAYNARASAMGRIATRQAKDTTDSATDGAQDTKDTSP